MAIAKKMTAKLIPRKRSTAVSSLRCRRRATDCTWEECRKARSWSSSDGGASAGLGVFAVDGATDGAGAVVTVGAGCCAAARQGAINGAEVNAAARAISTAIRKAQGEKRGETRTCGNEYFNGNPRQQAAGQRERPGRPDRRLRPESPAGQRRLRPRARLSPGAPSGWLPCGRRRGRCRARRSTA